MGEAPLLGWKPTPPGRVSIYDGSNGYFDATGGYFVDTPRHGGNAEVPIEALLSDDPALALVEADMDAWADAHPCTCPALCECEERSDKETAE